MNEISIEKLASGDLNKFIDLVRLFEVVFEMKNFSMPEPSHLQCVLNKSDFYVFVAFANNEVVGGLTAYTLEQYYSKKPLAYIYDLAVATSYQRRGIGRKLIATTNLYFTQHGFEEVFVQADEADDYALDFYHSTKPTAAEKVVHFYYSLH